MPKASPDWRTGRCRSGPGGWHPTSWPRLRPGLRLAALAAWVEAGPDLARDGVVRWRRRDLQRRIAVEFGVVLHERSVASN